eukprot:CAMPEP_0170085412 /NCGR_PEP_ID=MMETSP0019_2-20121128/20298_1 /TAXON_ID=98059 /ORGANISM="Dinobryon sp., Strain UTEXLB2267" /LENGTH=130 /DNA_ID=CAMNT_0010301853 /DNA_START=367 /DNA_END=759 /DNA_ORIENTATION=+
MPLNDTFAPSMTSSKDSRLQDSKKILSNIAPSAWFKLLACIAIDLVSDSSFLLPGVGEAEDIAWAPISAFLLKTLFDSNAVGAIEFAKEILPFTDIIPLATSVWFLENVFSDTPLAKSLGVGGPQKSDKN